MLIGELVEPTSAGLDSWYGGAAQDQFQLPMYYTYGFPSLLKGIFGGKSELSATYYRQQLLAWTGWARCGTERSLQARRFTHMAKIKVLRRRMIRRSMRLTRGIRRAGWIMR